MYDYFMEKFVYQMFVLGIENAENALSKGLGGVIFFTKDIQNEQILATKIKDIKNNALLAPFISVDQEGGRVERTENIRPKRISARYAFQRGIEFLEKQSNEISKELHNWGFNLNFAPCIDVNTNINNPIIGERAFSDNANDVIEGMNIFINASKKNKIIPCVKHFPGHGDADKDSHLTLPCIDLPLTTMEEIHIKPFKKAIDNNIEMIMVAHLHCTCFDSEVTPGSLSKNVIGYLRNKLNYKGVVITDDMVMKGVQNFGAVEACIMAINAGVDMFIFRNADKETLDIIEKVVEVVSKDEKLQKKVITSYNRILDLKKKYAII